MNFERFDQLILDQVSAIFDTIFYTILILLTVHLVNVFLIPNNSLYTFLTERSIQVLHVFFISNLVAVKN